MNAMQVTGNVLAAIGIGATMASALAQERDNHRDDRFDPSTGFVSEVRAATRSFQDVTAAVAAGYVNADGACVSGPDGGAMGVHYVNAAFVADGELDVQRPEVLVYEPRNGRLHLVAVEFLVDASLWDATNTGHAVLGGQLFHYVGAPNRLRLPAYYELHVWAWKRNPNGTFSDWNPRVSCVEYTGAMGAGHSR